MSAISNYLTFLRSAIYAIDVRDGIADAIEQCYNDVNNPTLKTEALEAALQTKIDEGEMAALTIGDGTITAAKLASGVIDNTLATSGAEADAAETGRQFGLIKADLGAQTGLFHWHEKGLIDLSGSSANLTPVTNQGINCAVVECSAGDKFIITGTGGNKSRAWGFIDSNNSILTVSDANATVENLEITAPTNSVRLVLNAYRSHNIYAYKVGNNLATKAQGGLSDDIKDAILGCLMNVTWGVSDYENVFNELENAFDGDNFYNTYSFDLNDLIKVNGGADVDYENLVDKLIKINTGLASRRRCFTVSRGRIPYLINLESSAYYPIPIPRNATKAIITWEPITQYFNCTTIGYIDNGQYKRISGSTKGWTTGGTIEIPLNEVGTTRALIVNSKYNDAGTSYPVEPSKLNIKFEKIKGGVTNESSV